MTTPSRKRSEVMARVKSSNTQPEMVVRRLVHGLGHRYRLHRKDLPGTPDLVLPRHGKVIFVHGCFWHQHHCRRGNRQPKSNQEYWIPKLQRNVQRDRRVRKELKRLGWSVLVVWECQTTAKHREKLIAQLVRFLEH